MSTVYHAGRSWVGHEIEDGCPCPKEPCGLVNIDRAVPECDQHRLSASRTMRQGHFEHQCPGADAQASEATR